MFWLLWLHWLCTSIHAWKNKMFTMSFTPSPIFIQIIDGARFDIAARKKTLHIFSAVCPYCLSTMSPRDPGKKNQNKRQFRLWKRNAWMTLEQSWHWRKTFLTFCFLRLLVIFQSSCVCTRMVKYTWSHIYVAFVPVEYTWSSVVRNWTFLLSFVRLSMTLQILCKLADWAEFFFSSNEPLSLCCDP